eukprot:2054975-Prymnesium_polylepis.2
MESLSNPARRIPLHILRHGIGRDGTDATFSSVHGLIKCYKYSSTFAALAGYRARLLGTRQAFVALLIVEIFLPAAAP